MSHVQSFGSLPKINHLKKRTLKIESKIEKKISSFRPCQCFVSENLHWWKPCGFPVIFSYHKICAQSSRFPENSQFSPSSQVVDYSQQRAAVQCLKRMKGWRGSLYSAFCLPMSYSITAESLEYFCRWQDSEVYWKSEECSAKGIGENKVRCGASALLALCSDRKAFTLPNCALFVWQLTIQETIRLHFYSFFCPNGSGGLGLPNS